MTTKYRFSNADEHLKRNVWAKGRAIPGYAPSRWRADMCGKPMCYDDHGDRTSLYGWEIDHIRPVSKGGNDHIDNLQPLHWKNNQNKSDTFPWYCQNAA